MNEKSKAVFRGILIQSWNEPRRFFFWLVLFSLFAFGLMVIIATSGGIPPLIHWVALCAILGFVLGAPAFALSWIPSFRPFFARLLQHKLLVVACIVTLIGLFYAVENWRGRNAWNDFRREWETRGVLFAWESIIPPAVPDDQNFFAAPPWEFLRFTKSNDAITWKYDQETRESKTRLEHIAPRGVEAPDSGSLFTAKRIDLRSWQDFYRGSNNLFAAGGQTFTNYFPVAANPQTPAKDVLLALTKSEATLQQLRAAARRPHARFWINYKDGFSAILPHLTKAKGHAQYLRLRTAALLADDQTDAALVDVMLAFRLNDTLRDESILISQLVRIASMHISLLAVWEGLADHRWSDAQLVALERELAKVDFLADYQRGMNGERGCVTWAMDFLRRTRDLDYIFDDASKTGYDSFGDQVAEATGRILFRLAPSGWFDQNKVSLGRIHVEAIQPSVEQEKQIVSPENSRRAAAEIELQSHRRSPYNLFTGMLLPALHNVAKKFANAQTYVNLARVACALERHRLAHDNYPEILDALMPEFIAKLPHDIINGQPLKYRRTKDGLFVLYSVGWNETDDGGTVALKKGGGPAAVDPDEGDWVWRYPAGPAGAKTVEQPL
jgi:hypothetical protein